MKRNLRMLFVLVLSMASLGNVEAQDTCMISKLVNAGSQIDANWPMEGDGNDVVGVLNNPINVGAGVSFAGIPFSGTAAAAFTGSGGILYSDGVFMETAATVVSFGAWIKPATVPPVSHQIIFDEGGTSGFSIYHSTGNEIVFVVADGSQANSDDLRFTFPTDGQYHHIAFTYVNGRLKVFLDGLIISQKATGFGSILAHSDDGGLGATFGTTSAAKTRFSGGTFTTFNGLMDEVFYTRDTVQDGNLLQYARCHGKSIPLALGCVSDAFMVQDGNSGWISINLATGKVNPATGTTDDGYSPAGTSLNGIGYNGIDGTLYGIDAQTGFIMQIQVTGTPSGYLYDAYRVAYIPELNNLNVVIGEVYNGKQYLREPTPSANPDVHYIVDVNPNSPSYLRLLSTVTESGTANFFDWAYNPQDSLLYTVSYTNGQLLSIHPDSGTITSLGSVGLGVNDTYGAVYFDNQGFLYIYNNTSGQIHRVDVDGADKKGVLFSTARSGLSLNDGSRCPAAPLPLDFGDAMDASSATIGVGIGFEQYRTTLSNNGPRHVVNSLIPLRMGSGTTLENDGKPSIVADMDLDDGVANFPQLLGGAPQIIPNYSVQVAVTNSYPTTNAMLYAWIDWDCDGNFSISEIDSTIVSPNTVNGIVTLDWSNRLLTGPNGTAGTYARFRLSTDTSARNSSGGAADGEVEDYFIPFLIPLPIPEIYSFTATAHYTPENKVTLNWMIEKCDYLESFAIERTQNFNNGFISIANVMAKDGQSAYTFTDELPLDSLNYYRLKLIDRDHNYGYSSIKVVNFSNLEPNSEINIYPNPFDNELFVELQASNEANYRLLVYDVMGKKIIESFTHLNENEFKRVKCSLTNYTDGIYFVHIIKDGSPISINKILKK